MNKEYSIGKNKKSDNVSGIDYSSELNEQQLTVVQSPPGHSLVIAGAGSGKTRTLTYRVAYLLDQGVASRNILLLTFTNKSSKEMLERVGALIPYDLSDLWGGTFHSIGSKILRKHADELSFARNFSILDRDDQRSFFRDLLAELPIDKSNKRFPKVDVLISLISLCRNKKVSLNSLIEEQYDHLLEWQDVLNQLLVKYKNRKQQHNVMDFDDLLLLAVKLLESNEEIRSLYQRKFRYTLVDEYQDTNAIQCQFIDLLIGESGRLMAVGDDAQSIYSWRGADMHHILNFKKRYPDATVFKIETNYRSSAEILSVSNEVIKNNEQQIEKTLHAFQGESKFKPVLLSLNDSKEQAAFVTERIQELQQEGIEDDQIAILYRAHFQSLELQLELTSQGIPFQITSGLRFSELAHIKDICSCLRFLTNPKDYTSFKRMALLLPSIGEKTAQKIWAQCLDSMGSNSALIEKLKQCSVPAKAKSYWTQLCYTLEECFKGETLAPPSEMIYSILEGFYKEYAQSAFENYYQREQDIQQLYSYAKSYTNVDGFLEQLSLLGGAESQESKKSNDQGVTLSSVHQAKGLEWKVVFIISLIEDVFPNKRALEETGENGLEEERRLFYVAVTRAKEQLYLSYPMLNTRSYADEMICYPSRFIHEIPEEMLDSWQVNNYW